MNPRSIIIEPVLNGFVLQVGCQRVVVKNVGELSGEIARYYSNPAETEKDYIEKRINNTIDGPAQVAGRPILRAAVDENAKCPEPTACEAPSQTERVYRRG